MSTLVFKIERGELGFSLTDPGKPLADATIADYQDFSCRVTEGACVPEQQIDTEEIPGTFCDPAGETNTARATTWSLEGAVLQDPNIDAATGLAKFLYENDSGLSASQTARPGGKVWFYLGLAQNSAPKAIGTCWISPTNFGGTPREILAADIAFPIDGRPELEFGSTADAEMDLTNEVFGTSPAPFADLAALQADPVFGDGGTSAPPAFTTGEFVRLQDQSVANYSGTVWASGIAT